MKPMVQTIQDIREEIQSLEAKLIALDAERSQLVERLETLQKKEANWQEPLDRLKQMVSPVVRSSLTTLEKIALFRRLFRGWEDVYPRRWENPKTGKSGYSPACGNEWKTGLCNKPRVKCGECIHQAFLPVDNTVLRNHLIGNDPKEFKSGRTRDFTIGVYPLLADETCWFLAVDFDKASWIEDTRAYLEVCRKNKVPAVLERSRSGKGGHIWLFFSEPIPASTARKLGSLLLTETMESRPELGFESYDRLFPSQDTLPAGGFGNLIALPFQRRPAEKGYRLFLDDNDEPYPDQWEFLRSIQRISLSEVRKLVDAADRQGRILGVRMMIDEEGEEPWTLSPSRKRIEPKVIGPHPQQIAVVVSNQLYIEKLGLSPSLQNRLLRLAAFQNPEFYQAQAMRLSTYNKPRVISCAELFSKHIGLPRGCREELEDLLNSLHIHPIFREERNLGNPVELVFQGELTSEQRNSVDDLTPHETGVLVATPAFGKTVVAAYMMALRGINTLILVHRRQLLDQWRERMQAFLNLRPAQIGQIGSGKRKPTGIVDIALIQSLVKHGEIDDIVANYGHVIFDECHHLSAVSFEAVSRQCKAHYVLGLTATEKRKDGHHPIILMQCGPIRHYVNTRDRSGLSSLSQKTIIRYTEFASPSFPEEDRRITINTLYSSLAKDQARNDLIIADVRMTLKENRYPIILTERREHLTILVGQLSQYSDNVFSLYGGMSDRQRNEVLERMKNLPEGQTRALVATGRYLGEGFDDARLDTLFLTMPISWRGTLIQYVGCLQRIHPAKREVLIYDYVDDKVPMLAHMSKKRLRGYRSLGYEIVISPHFKNESDGSIVTASTVSDPGSGTESLP